MVKFQAPGGAHIIDIDSLAETGAQIVREQAAIRRDLSAPGGSGLIEISILAAGKDEAPALTVERSRIETEGPARPGAAHLHRERGAQAFRRLGGAQGLVGNGGAGLVGVAADRFQQQAVQRLAHALAGHLHRRELAHGQDLGGGAVALKARLKPGHHFLPVFFLGQVDEIDDDEAADAAHTDLAGDGVRRLQINAAAGLLKIGGGGEAAGIDVDGGELPVWLADAGWLRLLHVAWRDAGCGAANTCLRLLRERLRGVTTGLDDIRALLVSPGPPLPQAPARLPGALPGAWFERDNAQVATRIYRDGAAARGFNDRVQVVARLP